jgi:hypothetical protein
MRVVLARLRRGLSSSPAVDSPRLHFASTRALDKLYVVRRLSRPDERADQDSFPGFLELLMPELNRCLFAAP